MASKEETEKAPEPEPVFAKVKTIESTKTWTLFGFIPIWKVSVTLEGEEDLYERLSKRLFSALNQQLQGLYNPKRR